MVDEKDDADADAQQIADEQQIADVVKDKESAPSVHVTVQVRPSSMEWIVLVIAVMFGLSKTLMVWLENQYDSDLVLY